MTLLEQSISAIRKKEAFQCLPTGASTDHIQHIESQLCLRLTMEYKWFLSQYGYLSWFGHALLGYSPVDPDYSTLNATLRVRTARLPRNFAPIPTTCNVIMKYGGGGYYVLFSEISEYPGKVILYTDDLGGREAERWESFAAFVAYVSRF